MKRFVSLCLAFIIMTNVASYAVSSVNEKNQDTNLSVQKSDAEKSGSSWLVKVGLATGAAVATGFLVKLFLNNAASDKSDKDDNGGGSDNDSIRSKSSILETLQNKFFSFYQWYHIVGTHKSDYDEATNNEIISKLNNAFNEVHNLLEGYGNLQSWFDCQISNIIFWDYYHLTETNWNPGLDIRRSFSCMSLYQLQELSTTLDTQTYIISHISVPAVAVQPM